MDDLISRQAAEDLFSNARMALYEQSRKERIKDLQTREMMLLNAQQFIHLLPSVEPERKTGMWIHDEDWECDQCGKHFINVDEDEYGVPHFDFCPNCGCEMGVV